ncbi:DUF3558 domain-containing protein [Allokutzneria sp. A3M-2-11 16]|uniref:DUF3558 domain-containing protein n=1 Tax=Allokutzneria sp. A3M-2-11 16 TaxID=2962043 RepID=UPI0020B8DE72|nr:DUF3558 domain-containing protein [Allokutzneria sp. A3M-2-11 16]MCP3803939.1 DUF3558 domain-containing protein [Allokutzneria sp. A3M-2-11 16]
MRRWAICSVLVLAGCAPVTAGEPTEVVRGPDSTVPPPITQPTLSFEKFLAKPCDLLSREQLASIGITTDPGKATTEVIGPRCRWEADKSMDTGISVTLMTYSDGLDSAYHRRDLGYFKETAIGGYPAVNTDNAKPVGRTTPIGSCDTAVGIAKSVAFRAGVIAHKPNPDYEQPCTASDRVASWVLEKLKTGT